MEHQSRVLILYSNPDDTSRIRLDKEHRAIDKVLDHLRLDPGIVRRLHAVTLKDVVEAIQSQHAEIIQFSGHGSDEGIYLDRQDHLGSELVDASRLAGLLKTAKSPPRVLILLSCFSSSTVGALGTIGPYLVTLTGEADDDACVEFASTFYRVYLATSRIEMAFSNASETVAAVYPEKRLYPVLSRRAATERGDSLVTVACRRDDAVLIDTSLAEDDIRALGARREEFLALLCRKIRVHRWVFVGSSDGTVLAIGPYFGVFTWSQVDDPVILSRLMRLRDDIGEEEAEVFGDLLVCYNDLRVRRYREAPGPVSGIEERDIKRAIEDHYGTSAHFFENPKPADVLRRLVPEALRAAAAMVPANLKGADNAFHRGDLGRTIAYLETALTTLHDLVDAVMERVTLPARKAA